MQPRIRTLLFVLPVVGCLFALLAWQLAMPIAAAAAGVELAQLAPPGSAQRVALATQAKQRALAVGCLHWAERASALLP